MAFVLITSSPAYGQEILEGKLFSEEPVYSSTPHFGMQVGSMFTTGFGGGNMFTQSFAPEMNWDLSKRFSLQVGTIFSTSTMNGMNQLFPYSPHMAGGESMSVLDGQRMFSNTVYAFGHYQVNSRLTLTGGTWMERTNLDFGEAQMNPQAFDNNPKGMMFGFDYKVNENFRFGAEINVSSGYNPYNPYQNTGLFNRGFHSPSPFHRPGRW